MLDIAEGFIIFLFLAVAVGIGQYHAVWGILLGIVFFGLYIILGIKDFLIVTGFGIFAIMCLVLVYGMFRDIFSGFFDGKRDKK